MAAAAPPPDGGCGHCAEHSGVVAKMQNTAEYASAIHAELKAHCNGGSNHPTRREMDMALEKIEENCRRIEAQKDAKITRSDKIEMGIIMAIISSAIAALSTLIK